MLGGRLTERVELMGSGFFVETLKRWLPPQYLEWAIGLTALADYGARGLETEANKT